MCIRVCNQGLLITAAVAESKCPCHTFTHTITVCTWSPKGAFCLVSVVSLSLSLSLTSSLHPSSLLHWAGAIIHGYVWKHSCASLIPPLIPQSQNTQNTTLLSRSQWQETCISDTHINKNTHTMSTWARRSINWHWLLLNFRPRLSG